MLVGIYIKDCTVLRFLAILTFVRKMPVLFYVIYLFETYCQCQIPVFCIIKYFPELLAFIRVPVQLE
jgi:hypothetical protein